MIAANLYGLSLRGFDLLIESEEAAILNFGHAFRGLLPAPHALAVCDWQALVEKVRRSADALRLCSLLRRIIDEIKNQLSGSLLRCRNDQAKVLNRPLRVIPKSLHPID